MSYFDAELLLKLFKPKLIHQTNGSFKLCSFAILEYIPIDMSSTHIKSEKFEFVSPIGEIEQNEICWYIEKYHKWPTGLFKNRAKETEANLKKWGNSLYKAILDDAACQAVRCAWSKLTPSTKRCFSISISSEITENNSIEEQKNIHVAASQLLSLPWELLHTGDSYLSECLVSVRRRLLNFEKSKKVNIENNDSIDQDSTIRILLLSPRPGNLGYFDYLTTAESLISATESLGERVSVTILTPPTYRHFKKELRAAHKDNKPYHVLHFDGHGFYNEKINLGGLCFEKQTDIINHQVDGENYIYIGGRLSDDIYAKNKETNLAINMKNNMADLLRKYPIPLVFLGACKTAKTGTDPNSSMAISLLEAGVSSIIAMSHSVLVKAETIFVTQFYDSLLTDVTHRLL